MAALPPGHRGELSHRARWLYRTLHAAELAGLDPAEVIRTAIASRDLAGSRDIAAVLDARIRPRVDPLLPQPQGSWTSRVPRLPDPARQAYLTGIAALMDDRTRRLGEHTAQTAPAWAITALGPVPADPAARHDWARKAAPIAAYREMYGYDHPGDPIGPEPSHQAPDQRAAWHQAFAALGPAAGPTSAPCPTAGCGCSATPTPPRPPGHPATPGKSSGYPGRCLRRRSRCHPCRRQSRRRPQGRRARPSRAPRASSRQLPQPAGLLQAARTDLRPGGGRPAGVGTGHSRSRQLAIAADAELRRRHPDRKIEPLRSSEPAPPVGDVERQHPDLIPRQRNGETTWTRDLKLQQSPSKQGRTSARAVPDEDAARDGPGETSPAVRPPWRDAVMQPPRPLITPSAEILQLAAEHDIEPEAGG